MRALRVVGVTEGGDVVLEDPGRRERFTVPADEQLRAAARGDITRLGQIAIELESQLRPREIQARIRAGASVEQVASAAGVPLQKIERFAYPVLLERSRTAEVAQRAHPVRADGPDIRTLGDVVAHTFGLRGQEYADAEWDSWKGEDGKWVVALSWRAGRSDNRAHWTFAPGANGGTVNALDEHASDLVEGLPAKPLRTVGPVIDLTARPDELDAPAPQPDELRAAASDTVQRTQWDPAQRHDWERPTRPERTQAEPERPGDRYGHGPDRPYADRPVYGERPSTPERSPVERSSVGRTVSARTVTERPAPRHTDVPVPAWAAEPADTQVPIERFTADPSGDPTPSVAPWSNSAPRSSAPVEEPLVDEVVDVAESAPIEEFPAADLVPAAERGTDPTASGRAPWVDVPQAAEPASDPADVQGSSEDEPVVEAAADSAVAPAVEHEPVASADSETDAVDVEVGNAVGPVDDAVAESEPVASGSGSAASTANGAGRANGAEEVAAEGATVPGAGRATAATETDEPVVHPEMPAQRSAEPEPVPVSASRENAVSAQREEPPAARPLPERETEPAAEADQRTTDLAEAVRTAGTPDEPLTKAEEPAADEPVAVEEPTVTAPADTTSADRSPVDEAAQAEEPVDETAAADDADVPATAEDEPAAEEPAAEEPAAKEPAAKEQAPAKPAAERTGRQPAKPPANRRTKKGKPVMPSWDEVLLGVRGQR